MKSMSKIVVPGALSLFLAAPVLAQPPRVGAANRVRPAGQTAK